MIHSSEPFGGLLVSTTLRLGLIGIVKTVRNCNYIYVMNKGRVVQEGSWSDLISVSNSLFVRMCQLQGINN